MPEPGFVTQDRIVPRITPGSSSPLTTKGDVFTFDTGNQRLGVGTPNQIITADPSTATGLKWVDATKVTFGATGKDRNRPSAATNADWLSTDTFQYYKSDGSIWYNAASGWDAVTVDQVLGGFSDTTYFAGPTGATNGPTMLNQTVTLGFYVISLPGTTGTTLMSYTSGNILSGWALSGSTVNSNKFRLVMAGLTGTSIELSGLTAITTGFHVIAFSFDGTTIKACLDGGTVFSVAPGGAYTVPTTAALLAIGRFASATTFSSPWMRFGYFQGFTTVLSNADMQTLTGTPSSFVPVATTNDPGWDFQARWLRNEGTAGGVGGVSLWQIYGTQKTKASWITAIGNGIAKTFQ